MVPDILEYLTEKNFSGSVVCSSTLTEPEWQPDSSYLDDNIYTVMPRVGGDTDEELPMMDRNVVYFFCKETLNKVSEYIRLLNESGLLIDKAYLFGSAARNEQHEGSDIDVMLVSTRFDDSTDDIAFGLIWRLTRKVDSRIEPYAVGLSRFNNDDVSPLLQIVKLEGIPIL